MRRPIVRSHRELIIMLIAVVDVIRLLAQEYADWLALPTTSDNTRRMRSELATDFFKSKFLLGPRAFYSPRVTRTRQCFQERTLVGTRRCLPVVASSKLLVIIIF